MTSDCQNHVDLGKHENATESSWSLEDLPDGEIDFVWKICLTYGNVLNETTFH